MMNYCMRVMTTMAVFILCYSIFAQDAYAYIDPGTGSYVFQMFIAAIVGGFFAVKLFWTKILLFFKGLFSRQGK